MRFAAGFRTDVGRGRPENEDSLLVDTERRLYAVADGMGGHRAGEVASATAIETLQDAYRGGQALDQAVVAANAAVFAKAAEDLALRGMGTTMTALALDPDGTALFGHVGDSRAYLMRDGAVSQVTVDHSLVEQLVREGRLSPEEAAHHPQRAISTRALGVDAQVEVDTYRVALQPGDRLLICSDGLTNMLSDETITATLHRYADPQEAADTLVDMANQAGGDDNISVVVLDALAEAAAPVSASDTAAHGLGGSAPPDPPEALGAEPALSDHSPLVPEKSGHGLPPEMAGIRAKNEAPPRAGGRRVGGVLRWGLPILLVLGIGIGAVGWYARRTYYVGLSADRVVLYKGVPGGLLGWKPTVDRQTSLTAADLTPADRADLEGGHRFASRTDADRFLARLQETHEALAGHTTTTSGTVSATQAPEPTTVTSR